MLEYFQSRRSALTLNPQMQKAAPFPRRLAGHCWRLLRDAAVRSPASFFEDSTLRPMRFVSWPEIKPRTCSLEDARNGHTRLCGVVERGGRGAPGEALQVKIAAWVEDVKGFSRHG